MTCDETTLHDLDRADRKQTARERMTPVMILVIGLVLALFIGYDINLARGVETVRSIRCEEGDVTLILERVGGSTQRVECPAVVPVKP